MLTYEPLCRGLFSGAWTMDRRPRKRDLRRRDPRFEAEERASRLRLVEALQPVAMRHGLSLAQLSIAFAGSDPRITGVLAGVRTTAQVDENMGCTINEPERVASLRAEVLRVVGEQGLLELDA